MADSWQETIWREWYFCYDDDYASRLQRLIGEWPAEASEDRLKEMGRPSTMMVEAALRQACKVRRSKYDWDKRLRELDQTRHRSLPVEELLYRLNARHWLDRVIACHLLVSFGGEAIDSLKTHLYSDSLHLQSLARWILQSIGVETTGRLSRDAGQLLCTTCFVHCHPLEIVVPGDESITYYGCRACGQSRSFKTWPEGVVAALDAGMGEDHVASDGNVRVNWLQRRVLFDFDWVEFVQVTDEDAERFAVQAGNDTDPVRKPRYAEMRYVIDPNCQLSPNTLRVLDSIFGDLEQIEEEKLPMQEPILPWQKILWREWHHCQDPSYKRRLGRLVADLGTDWETKTAGRPTTTEIEKALFEACQTRPLVKSTWSQILEKLSEQLTRPDPVNSLVLDLKHEDWAIRFIARHTLVALGGEAVPALTRLAENRTYPQQLDIQWLLRCIELDTTARLYPLMDRLVCPRCLVHCHAHWIDVPGVMPLAYYGCRNCGQSREFLEWTGNIVAVLDTAMTEPFAEQDDALRGNWFLLRTLFDFDRVEVIRASDEEVERFAVEIGNDTDEIRAARYKEMQCVIDSACELSKNTTRILQHTFGHVKHTRMEE